MKKYLLIRQRHKRTRGIWDAVQSTFDPLMDIEEMDQKDAAALRSVMARLRGGHDYHRVIFDANLRNIGREWRHLCGVERLVIFDNDLYHHYNARSSYRGLFVAMLKSFRPHRVIATGLYTVNGFRQAGLNVSYLPKSYDPALIQYREGPRDIEYGFIGRLKNKVYADRRLLLDELRGAVGLQTVRTEDGPSYCETLNRIRFFISADQGLNEYMAKNFEALAAGCVLCAARTIPEEAEYLGFSDMENVVLYDSAAELVSKLSYLRANPERVSQIAERGRRLAETRHSDVVRAAEIMRELDFDLLSPPAMTLEDRFNMCRLRARDLLCLSSRIG